MSELRYTLVSDGPSDAMLLPVLDWILESHSSRLFVGRRADLRNLRRPPTGLAERVRTAVELHPCDLLFVHRDAERSDRASRMHEIERQLADAALTRWIGVVPVRMQEAWFLFDERALREAAGNPSGEAPLDLPALRRVEGVPNPKRLLETLLKKASGHGGRRLEKLRVGPMKYRVAALIADYSPLRAVPAFASLEAEVERIVAERKWG